MASYDTPQSVERYRRAFAKLTASGELSANAALQCEKLRIKLQISEELHERLLSELTTPEEEITLELACAWRGGASLECGLIHRGDFTFDRVEIVALSTQAGELQRFEWGALDPGERELFTIELLGNLPSDQIDLTSALTSAGVQLQIRALDITEEVLTYRSPLLSVASVSGLNDLKGRQATLLTELNEPRALQSLLGSSDWREVPLVTIAEDEFFQWEVQVTRTQSWVERERAEEWRVGDQTYLTLNAADPSVAELRERLCPGGVSWIGAPLGVGRDWETPAHQARISHRLWCAETPITRGLWSEIMGDPLPSQSEYKLPAGWVSWMDAIRFCNRLSARLSLSPVYELDERGGVRRLPHMSGYRLPTEAEWEHLARAGLDRAYAGSNLRDSVCWSLEDGEVTTQEVGERRPNAWGLFDCCGNVWEWCEDVFSEEAYRGRIGVTRDPRQWDTPSAVKAGRDPDAPDRPQPPARRVRRGGSVVTPEESCRVFTRVDGALTWRSEMVGLRVVRSGELQETPHDRGARAETVTWDHLSSSRLYLGGVTSSPRRAWALRLGALGVQLTEREEEADILVIIPPLATRPTPRALTRLDAMRRRASGVGIVVLELDELDALITERERAIYNAETRRVTWSDLYGKRVLLLGRFRSTQHTLKLRLRGRGVRLTIQAHQADILLLGGGTLTARQHAKLERLKEGALSLTEIECLALLEAPEPLSLPD